MLFTCAYSALLAPKTDLMYFFTSLAIGTNPVMSLYNTLSRAILELLMAVNAVAKAVFLAVMSACFAVSVAIFKSFSFGAYVGSDCRTEIRPAKCCMS